MQKRLDDKQFEEALKRVEDIIDGLEKHYPGVRAMMDGAVGEEFTTAPASSREEYHSCFPGGLMTHSLRVIDNLKTISDSLVPGRYSDQKLNFVGLFHDFGKVGDGTEPYYIPEREDWQKNRGNLYKINPKCVFMPTSERGLFVLQKHGIALTTDEYLAIRLNDGMYDETNKRYAMREPDLALLVHFADRWSCTQEKA